MKTYLDLMLGCMSKGFTDRDRDRDRDHGLGSQGNGRVRRIHNITHAWDSTSFFFS